MRGRRARRKRGIKPTPKPVKEITVQEAKQSRITHFLTLLSVRQKKKEAIKKFEETIRTDKSPPEKLLARIDQLHYEEGEKKMLQKFKESRKKHRELSQSKKE
ncbi:MAG: hypothetical protein HON47_00060 [Candidatus Diapherotrites archaeon]|jgi:hypothetical protein|uniref:Uncharacterized protein n=1 Tax=Candidatus Iainarchaeum sp. TaxID=3101447 RepID=A0A8T5GCV2_9ARCH|nr:hypothetical protein [Candidatus Diapherotrites archaeon]